MKVRRDAMGKLKTRGTITGTHAQAIGMIVAVAHLYHWRVVFFRPARTMKGWRTPVGGDGKGFVDLVLARDERVLFWEVKVGRDRLRPEQEAWLACLGGRVVNPFDDPDWQYILEALS